MGGTGAQPGQSQEVRRGAGGLICPPSLSQRCGSSLVSPQPQKTERKQPRERHQTALRTSRGFGGWPRGGGLQYTLRLGVQVRWKSSKIAILCESVCSQGIVVKIAHVCKCSNGH